MKENLDEHRLSGSNKILKTAAQMTQAVDT